MSGLEKTYPLIALLREESIFMAIPNFQTLVLHRPRLRSFGKADLREQTDRRRFALVKFMVGEKSK
jgi:hypothetical protein